MVPVALLFLGALLTAAPCFSNSDPEQREGAVIWFRLDETQDEIQRRFGSPHMAAEFGTDYVSWQYRIAADADDHEHSHILVFRKSTRTLVSVTRAYEPERNVDEFFPPSDTSEHAFPDASAPRYRLRLRRLSGGRVLMAMGSAKPGEPTGQLVLMRRDVLRVFYPWLDEQLVPRD